MADDFAQSVADACDGFMASATAVVVATTVRVGLRMIDASPVDTGEFKGGWHLTEGRDTSDVMRLDGGGAETSSELADRAIAAGVGREMVFQNNKPYAEKLEDGHSPQAAPGTIWRVNAQAAPFIAREEGQKIGMEVI